MEFYGYDIGIYLHVIDLSVCHLYLCPIFCSFLIEKFVQIRASVTSQTPAILGRQIQRNLKKNQKPTQHKEEDKYAKLYLAYKKTGYIMDSKVMLSDFETTEKLFNDK